MENETGRHINSAKERWERKRDKTQIINRALKKGTEKQMLWKKKVEDIKTVQREDGKEKRIKHKLLIGHINRNRKTDALEKGQEDIINRAKGRWERKRDKKYKIYRHIRTSSSNYCSCNDS